MTWIGKLWRGEYGLAMTYWGFGFLSSIVLFVVVLAIEELALTSALAALVSLGIIVAMLVYGVILMVGIWRAANLYTGSTVWVVLAKIAVVLGAINTVGSLLKH